MLSNVSYVTFVFVSLQAGSKIVYLSVHIEV